MMQIGKQRKNELPKGWRLQIIDAKHGTFINNIVHNEANNLKSSCVLQKNR